MSVVVKEIKINIDTGTVFLDLKGKVYQYDMTHIALFELLHTPSKGKFYNKHIKGKYNEEPANSLDYEHALPLSLD